MLTRFQCCSLTKFPSDGESKERVWLFVEWSSWGQYEYKDKKEAAYCQINQCTDVREIWYHKGLFQKQMENSEITNYEETSPETKDSQDFFKSQFITLCMQFKPSGQQNILFASH